MRDAIAAFDTAIMAKGVLLVDLQTVRAADDATLARAVS